MARGWRGHASPEVANPDVRQRFVIVNADDLGISDEIDHGIFEAHDRRIVTSASLLVDGPHAADAVRLARQRPGLGLGIHVAFDDRGRWLINVQDPRVVQREVTRQLEAFERMTGVPPTHIDSHHHAHRFFNVARHFIEAGQRLPARAAPGVSEVSCHPGHLENRADAQYNREREVELRSLCDAQVKAAIAEESIRLISFREYARIAARPRPSCRGAS